MDVTKLMADVEEKYPTATREERNDLIGRLRDAEGELADDDAGTRTDIGELIDRVQRSFTDEPDQEFAPPVIQGTGFGSAFRMPTSEELGEQGR